MQAFSAHAQAIRRRLTGESVVAPSATPAALTDRELGALAALVWCPRPAGDDLLVHGMRDALRARSPRFDEASAIAALRALAQSAKELAPVLGAASTPHMPKWVEQAACKVIAGSDTPLSPSLLSALAQCTDAGFRFASAPIAIALRSLLGVAPEPHPDPFMRRENAYLCQLVEPRDRITMAEVCDAWTFGTDDEALSPRGSDPLALLPGYLDFAAGVVRDALARAESVQSGAVPYAADKAFSTEAAQVIRNALRAGLDQDAPWALAAAGPLLAAVSLAPSAQAKTVPSQSAAIAIAKAIAERPTTTLVAQMKASVARMRHAGLKKKCARLLQTAERRLFERDDFLLDLDPHVKVPKSMSNAVTRAFESLLLPDRSMPYAIWRARVLENPATAPLAARLVWHVEGVGTVLPVRRGSSWSFEDASGRAHAATDGAVSLWHPLDADGGAVRDAWRARIVADALEQPFNQVFRETYSATSIPPLLQPELDTKTLLGLAQAQGWLLRDGGVLTRRVAHVRVQFDAGGVYPGATGSTRCHALGFFDAKRATPVEASHLSPKLLSECLRAVDLLVSVSAFALAPEDAPSASAQARAAALTAMLGSEPDPNRPYVSGRRVHVGDVAISIATGRVTRAGAEVALPSVARVGSTVVLPYPDEILMRIVAAVNHFAR